VIETETMNEALETCVDIRAVDDACSERVMQALDEIEQLGELLEWESALERDAGEWAFPASFKLSVVIPVFNEAGTIGQVVERVAALPVEKEIVIVDDASTDGTREVLWRFDAADNVHVIFKPQNEGKGAALRTGFRRVTGDVVVVQDADLEYDPRDILPLVMPIVSGEADVVYGSRFLGEEPQDKSLVHRMVNRLLTAASNWTTGLTVTDMETCYKAFRREVLQSFEIRQPRFGFEPEVTAKIARRKYRVSEVPVRYAARGYAEGKKIGVRDLFSAVWCIVRYGIRD
jgi:glycosyltransferase involved in cell wall biosynthesis